MHSFSYASAEKQFHDLEAKQPDCAMAYWGEAMSLMRQLVSVPEPADMQRGRGTHPKGAEPGAENPA